MDDRTIGAAIRALRRRRGLTQEQLAARCGVSRTTIARLEQGDLGAHALRLLRAVAAGLDARLTLELTWRGAGLARLLDEGHARLVETTVRLLRALGWEVIAEYTFNHYGERGSIDIVAWHPLARILLVVEVKTRLADLQETLARLHAKVRVVPPLLARERGWKPVAVARLLVIADRTAQRDIVARHRAIFDGAFPLRGRAVRRWLAEPIGATSGLVFFRDSRGENTARRLGGDGRVEATGGGRGRA